MLRRDGEYTVYIIQHQYNKDATKGWHISDCGAILFGDMSFDEARSPTGQELRKKISKYENGAAEISAQTATFSMDDAITLMRIMVERVPAHNYRVIERIVSQKTNIIETISRG